MTNKARSTYRHLCAVLFAGVFLVITPVRAEQGHHGYDRDHFYSPHWELDGRHRHDYYYPARGYVVPALPPGYLDLTFGGGHFFFRSGVWFRADGQQFVVARPPVGIRLGILPPSYSTLWIGGVPYYYANGIYYSSVPNTSEYVVVDPPPGYETAIPQLAPTPSPAFPPPTAASPQTAPGVSPSPSLFVYPRDGQTQSEITADRNECNGWATGQTGYDPTRSRPGGVQGASDFQRAVRTCLEGKGYTVN